MEDNSPNDRNKTTADLPPDATSQSATEFCSRADPRASTSETQPRLALQQGARLLDRYRIVRLLGQGASGSVYEAVDEARSGLRVAVKLLAVHQPQALYRLKNEFRALAETVHPNLVGLHSLAVEPHGWFVVMDLIDPSCDFRSYVRSGDAGKLDEGRLRSAFAQLVRGVCAIHAAGKLHRDLKPGNVLVTRDGRVVIVDFGLVGDQAPGGVGNTMDGWFSGTPAYAAPEQALGSEVGPKADVYALGVLLFEALTDRLPFEDDVLTRLLERKLRDQAPDPRSFVADAPEDLSALALSMLQRDPELRPDAQQLLAGLESEPFTSGVMPLLPFVARESEIALLRDAAALVRDGSPVLLVLSGPSGIGKTALLTKFLELMQLEAGAVVLAGRCRAQEHVSYNAFDMLVDALGRHLVRLSPVEAASLMSRDVALLARLFPTLARVPAVLRMPANINPDLDEGLLRARAFAALKELLARVADRAPLILCFDDLQWADNDSLELLRELLRAPGAPPCLFLCVARSSALGEPDVSVTLGASTPVPRIELRLGPLDAAASRQLARATLGTQPSDADLGLVVQESAGNPFLLKELSRGARTRGRVDDLSQTVAATCAELDAAARTLLELTCVAGQPLELGLAMRASAAEPQSLPSVLATSLIKTCIRHGQEHLECSHDRIEEAVLQAVDAGRLTQLHAALGDTLATYTPPDAERIAWHYRAAGLMKQAVPYLIRAAERASAALAFGHAAELYEMALAEAGEAEQTTLGIALAEAYASVGKLSEAAERYERVHMRLTQTEQRRGLAAKSMLLWLLAGQSERGARLADQLCRQLGVMPLPHKRIFVLMTLAWVLLRYLLGPRLTSLPAPSQSQGAPINRERLDLCMRASRGFLSASPDHSVYFGLQAFVLARRYRDPRTWPLAIAGELTFRCLHRGTIDPHTVRDMQRAMAMAEAQGDPEVRALVLSSQGSYMLFCGQPQQAALAFEQAERTLIESGRSVIHDLNTFRVGRLACWELVGQFQHTLRHCDTWLAEARALGHRHGEISLRWIGAQRFLALDDPVAAREALWDLRSESGRNGLNGADPWRLGDVAMYEGNSQAALAEYEQAKQARFFSSMQRVPMHRVWCCLYLARACLMEARQRRNPACERLAEKQARSLERERHALAPAIAAQIRAGLAILRGNQTSALAKLTEAALLYDIYGLRLYAAAARYHAGNLQRDGQGAALVSAAVANATASGVRNPERWFHSFVTGFAE